MSVPVCPECQQGKHGNCTGWAIDDYDRIIFCGCDCRADPHPTTEENR